MITSYLYLVLLMIISNLVIFICHQNDVPSIKRSAIAEDYAKAFDHGARVRNEGSCHQPRPIVVYVNKTDPSKVHLPRGTVLHRCSDQTGCCTNPSENCVPIEMQTVELYFIAITLQVNKIRRHIQKTPNVEKLLFTNHTMCGCRKHSSNDDIDPKENEIE